MQGVLRTPAEGEGGAAHRENFNAARRPRGAFPPPLTTESPTTHYCTVQHHVPIDPYAERMPLSPLVSTFATTQRGEKGSSAFSREALGRECRKQVFLWPTPFSPRSAG